MAVERKASALGEQLRLPRWRRRAELLLLRRLCFLAVNTRLACRPSRASLGLSLARPRALLVSRCCHASCLCPGAPPRAPVSSP